MSKLFTATGAARRLAELGVPLSAARVRQLDAELRPERVDDGGRGERVYRNDALEDFARDRAARKDK
jgi:hypothetical protein